MTTINAVTQRCINLSSVVGKKPVNIKKTRELASAIGNEQCGFKEDRGCTHQHFYKAGSMCNVGSDFEKGHDKIDPNAKWHMLRPCEFDGNGRSKRQQYNVQILSLMANTKP